MHVKVFPPVTGPTVVYHITTYLPPRTRPTHSIASVPLGLRARTGRITACSQCSCSSDFQSTCAITVGWAHRADAQCRPELWSGASSGSTSSSMYVHSIFNPEALSLYRTDKYSFPGRISRIRSTAVPGRISLVQPATTNPANQHATFGRYAASMTRAVTITTGASVANGIT